MQLVLFQEFNFVDQSKIVYTVVTKYSNYKLTEMFAFFFSFHFFKTINFQEQTATLMGLSYIFNLGKFGNPRHLKIAQAFIAIRQNELLTYLLYIIFEQRYSYLFSQRDSPDSFVHYSHFPTPKIPKLIVTNLTQRYQPPVSDLQTKSDLTSSYSLSLSVFFLLRSSSRRVVNLVYWNVLL